MRIYIIQPTDGPSFEIEARACVVSEGVVMVEFGISDTRDSYDSITIAAIPTSRVRMISSIEKPNDALAV